MINRTQCNSHARKLFMKDILTIKWLITKKLKNYVMCNETRWRYIFIECIFLIVVV